MKTERTPRPLTAAAALALCVATAVAGPAVKTVYQEDFDGYGDFTAS
ncbi:MAG: hypothetical protein GX590_09830, partial [Lentisphaerae bacterium]|nr:hypothetical protein [Lentisphaerota bacterium]